MEGKEQEHYKNDCKNGPRHVNPCLANKRKSQVDPIPLDLTMEILARLPVKSLLKFQYVSKTWCSIIRSKDFINSSVSMSSMPSSQLIISFKNGQFTDENAEKCLFFFTSSQEKDHESSSLVANLDMRMASMDAYFYVRCASVNGFICLSYKGRFMICNPTTRQVIALPELTGTNSQSTCKFLGYDPVDDHYKAMCKGLSNSEGHQEHMVLTLGGDKKPSWRRMEGTTRDYYPLTKGICINGFVYYGASAPIPYSERLIVCFDVRSERLSFIKIPSRLDIIDWERTSYLINYQGKLAYVNEDKCYGFYLCVLQDAKEHQWSMKTYFRVSLGKIPMSIQGTNKTGEIIITPKFLPRGLQPFKVIYYNVESDKSREVQLEGVADDEDFRRRYGIEKNGNCQVYIWPEHGANYNFL